MNKPLNKPLIAIAMALGAWAAAGAAAAHQGPKLLTVFGADERASATSGVSSEHVNGVHLYEGATRLAGGEPGDKAKAPSAPEARIVIVIDRPWRRIRKLRTQGFYSGDRYPSRAFTQGFYSGD